MARVAIVEPRSSGWWLIDCAAAMGHEPVIITAGAGARRVPAEHLRHAHHVETVDTNADHAVLEAVRRLRAAGTIDAILPGYEYYVPLTATLADYLGLPGTSPQAACRLLDKHLMREALAAAGISQPRYALVRHPAGLARAVNHTGLPCVVKPVAQCASLHVRKAVTLAAAQAAFREAREDDTDLNRPGSPQVLVEEYISGPEVSVDGFVQDGETHVLSVTAKVLGPEPYFVEAGHFVPGALDDRSQEQVVAYVGRVIGVLGLTMGPIHVEVRLGPRGPMLIEAAGRLPGDHIPRLIALTRGVDLIEIMLRSYLGQRVETSFPAFQACAGIRYFLRPGLRRYREVTVPDDLRGDRRIAELAVTVPAGVALPSATSSRGRIGYAIAVGQAHHEVAELLQRADDMTVFT